eukprot:2543018-Pyramimonas_sp.AAC.1
MPSSEQGPSSEQDMEHPPFPDADDDVQPPVPEDAAALLQVRVSTTRAADLPLITVRRLAAERHLRAPRYVAVGS